ncbi:hypothetical protein ETTORE_0394 [Pseudomonas phage Ettore]|nr:hypothetical protein ETTORE_0394 [Pseudomonas phage Ettore]
MVSPALCVHNVAYSKECQEENSTKNACMQMQICYYLYTETSNRAGETITQAA